MVDVDSAGVLLYVLLCMMTLARASVYPTWIQVPSLHVLSMESKIRPGNRRL